MLGKQKITRGLPITRRESSIGKEKGGTYLTRTDFRDKELSSKRGIYKEFQEWTAVYGAGKHCHKGGELAGAKKKKT